MAKKTKLGDRDYEILDHVRRYRLSTREILHKLFFDDSEINAVSKVTSRLERAGFLSSHDLDGAKKYYGLGSEACRLFGLSLKKTKPLGSQALPTELGMLHFCCASEVQRTRLLVGEISKSHPDWLAKGIDSSHYYYDQLPGSEQAVLGLIRVDQGGPPDHIARKCAADIEKRLKVPAFTGLIERGHFVIAVVTGHDSKAELIKDTLARRSWTIRFRIEVCPDLATLISRTAV